MWSKKKHKKIIYDRKQIKNISMGVGISNKGLIGLKIRKGAFDQFSVHSTLKDIVLYASRKYKTSY